MTLEGAIKKVKKVSQVDWKFNERQRPNPKWVVLGAKRDLQAHTD